MVCSGVLKFGFYLLLNFGMNFEYLCTNKNSVHFTDESANGWNEFK